MEYGRIIPERKKGCRNETGNGKKVGIWICLSPNNYYLNPTYLLSILLLLSESYGSAFKSILAFNYEKIALVGSGRRSEDRKSRKKVLYYLSVLWLFHFTNRSPPVYYGWCQEKIKIIAAMFVRLGAVQSLSYYQISISGWFEKKNSGKKKGCSYYLLHVPRVIGQKFSQKQKAAKERKQKSEMSLLLFLVNWVGSWKRRLVAEEGSLSKKTWLQKINRGWWAPELGPVVGNGYRREVSWNAERLCKWLRGQEI